MKRNIIIKKFKDLPRDLITYIELLHGPIDIQNDFFSEDLKTYFKTYFYDPETKSSGQYIIKL